MKTAIIIGAGPADLTALKAQREVGSAPKVALEKGCVGVKILSNHRDIGEIIKLTALGQRKGYTLKAIFWLIAILLGFLQIWVHRYSLSTDDGIAYLDIGDAYLRGEWSVAINGYWSPLYSWLLSLTLAVLKPSAYWEFFGVKIVNFLIYIFALISFEFFLRQLILSHNTKISESSSRFLRIPEWVWVVSGYILFLWSALKWTPLYSDTPDLCTAALVYLTSGILLRLHTRSANWFSFIALGATLGFAYLSKTVMFPISFVFIAISAFSGGNLKRSLPRALVALVIFTIVTAPFIAALSLTKDRFTFGDTGKLNYAWHITGGVQGWRYWQGEESAWGTPKHSPRKIFDNPEVLEFATPVGGTYPLWHDPSYWYEGLKFRFNLRRQIAILARNIFFYYELFFGSLIFSYLILVCAGGKFWLSVKDLKENWKLLTLAVAGLGAYAIGIDLPRANAGAFQPSTRYIAPFIVLLFTGVFSSVRLPNSQESKRLIAGMTIATLVLIGNSFFWQASKDFWTVLNRSEQHIQWKVADELHQLGVQPGEQVAILGTYDYPHDYWARLARVKIIAEVLDKKDKKSFWEANPRVRAEILKAIEDTGATVIVQKPGLKIPDSALATSWQKIGNTDYYAYFFNIE